MLLTLPALILASALNASAALLPDPLEAIPAAVEGSIRAGETPGAVILIGHQGQVIFHQAFGHRRLTPPRPMTLDAVFDIASLTKVVATAPAILQLSEKGRLRLDDPVARHLPEFKGHSKELITVRQLLSHYSGLRPGLLPKPAWTGYEAALKKICADTLPHPAGTVFTYSDLNFILLGEIVRRVSGELLENYCRRYLFQPLGMADTGFKPPAGLRSRFAPTMEGSFGVVHDPDTRKMGGVSGAAGVFATAADLARFAQALLDDGRSDGGQQILSHDTVAEMARPNSPAGKLPARGLGWAISSPTGNWSEKLPPGSFGHKGFTGTLLWIDPETQTYLIVLSNRVYPDGEVREETLRDRIFSLAVQATGRPAPADTAPTPRPPARDPKARVMSGVDMLAAQRFAPLSGKRVGLITNHTGLDSRGRRTIDLLAKAPGVKLRAIFTPEHGLFGLADSKVASGRDAATQVPVYSLYGETLRPKPEAIKNLDALVFDVQDAGARFYTYMTTMAYAMEAAAKRGIDFFVLDRPNPVRADRMEGPVMDPDLKSFTGYFPLPVRHGLTLGELATLFNGERKMGVKLTVIPMKGYRRGMWFDETGLVWVNPSPNLRSLTQAILYPGVALSEACNVSVGRGTRAPFELIGAPWIRAGELADYLRGCRIPGAGFEPATFLPEGYVFTGQPCQGVRILVTNRDELDSVRLGVEILCALQRLYPGVFQLDRALHLLGSRAALQAIAEGQEPGAIAASWQPKLDEFRRLSASYQLY